MPKHYRAAGKKKEGNVARYITRSQATKHLQVSLPLFRRLCILKGVFPREPKKKYKGNHVTYYHVKDIAFVQHDPLLETSRNIKAYDRKVKKAFAKKESELARKLIARRPEYKLDKNILSRYPRFIDALRDLDNCLCMVHLFAAFPAIKGEKVTVEIVHNCRRLCHEWQAYISCAHKLRKTFISIKGFYYQAEIEGEKITWLVPHGLQHVVTDDIDFNVMLINLEFYQTLLAFINFKLYHSLNIDYSRLESFSEDLYALSKFINANKTSPQHNLLPSNESGASMPLVEEFSNEVDDDEDSKVCKNLFKDMKFFLSREAPKESLIFLIPAFGGLVSWDGDEAPFKEADPTITYQIVDRPTLDHIFLTREYVQPQWIYDCVNAQIILPTEGYMVGRVPPPHLSPFVDNEAEGYVPEYAETIKRLQDAAKNEVRPLPGLGKDDFGDPQNLLIDGVMSRTEESEAAKRREEISLLKRQHLEDLQKELMESQKNSGEQLNGLQMVGLDIKKNSGEEEMARNAAEDISKMSEVLLPRKKRGLLEAMKIGKERRKADVAVLEKRKKRLKMSRNEKTET